MDQSKQIVLENTSQSTAQITKNLTTLPDGNSNEGFFLDVVSPSQGHNKEVKLCPAN